MLGESQASNIKAGLKLDTGKGKQKAEMKPKPQEIQSPVEEIATEIALPTPLSTEIATESPFAILDTPVSC